MFEILEAASNNLILFLSEMAYAEHCTWAIIFFIFCFTDFFSQVSVGGRNKNKSKIHFPIESTSQETQLPFILIQLENGPNEFYFTN